MATWTNKTAQAVLLEMFNAAIKSADPHAALMDALPEKPKGRCIVVGAGKASAAMAAALEAAWPDVALSGVVVTRYGHAVPTRQIRIIEAAHPVSDSMSEVASMLILESVKNLTPDDLVIALISGGGSALMALPRTGITLADKQAVNKALLRSGATIQEMNAVRKHFSDIKGGRLALAALPAKVVTLVISDVPGDNPEDIASGPTVPDSSTLEQVRVILSRYHIDLPEHVSRVLCERRATVSAADIQADVRMIATPSKALQSAAAIAERMGITPLILGDALEGESAQLGIMMAGIARSVKHHGLPVKTPAVLLSGGETTVTIGKGSAKRGGRNTEFLLSLANTLAGEEQIWAMAGDSDGIDGTEDAAGAFVCPDSLFRAREREINAKQMLDEHDSYTFFAMLNDLIKTGPTLTNVNDIRAILIV
ncbi:glycerate kinase [Buttiauxella gaviniae]|uniref:Glycerate kinase n=1 Tax=Buttiauxella gaviniae TaxID=82990 RepID=A0ABV3NWQ3_9ENTR